MSTGNVHVTDLPGEVLAYIFSFLDAEGLIACAGVNATWNEVTNDVNNRIWFQACLKAGIYVEEDMYADARDWKDFLSSMLRRQKAMKDSTCFTTDHYDLDDRINVIYCHKEKIALAFIDRIEIRNASQGEILHVFECSSSALYLKFDDNILIAASRYGLASSWSMKTGGHLGDYYIVEEESILSSFDILTDHDIVASSYHRCKDFTSFIQIRSMSSGHVFIMDTDDVETIGRVMLAPNRDHPVNKKETTCYLFCLTVNYVTVMTVTLEHQNIWARMTASLRILPSPLGRRWQTVFIGRKPWGLLFDGKEVYFMTRLPPVYSMIICAWNFRTNSRRYLENDERITNILGVGKKYIVYEIEVENTFKRVVVANKTTAEIIAIVRTPRSTAEANDDCLCLADTSWLDGINGANDRGAVCALIAEDRLRVYVAQFVPRNECGIF